VVAAIVGQYRGDVDVEREQVADRIAVFGTVQSMDDEAARRRTRRPAAVERVRQPGGEADVFRFARMGTALRRHRPDAQLAEHALPHRRIGDDVVEIRRIELERIVRR
jgi:hypothetical protein